MSNRIIDSEELLAEYNYDKNVGIDLDKIYLGSHKKVWWKCSKGHEWEAEVCYRSKGYGCPYCNNLKALAGYNDFATTNPVVAHEWNYSRNGSLLPSNVLSGSHKKVWWKCKNGHEWEATVRDRAKGSKCPFCSNLKVLPGYNDLATRYPQIAQEWNYEKNGDLSPQNVVFGSMKKVWWKCARGHEWEATIDNRSRGHGCPYCCNFAVLEGYNDLATTNPKLASEWNYSKNQELRPTDITPGSHKSVWWICNKGHEWKAEIKSRNSGENCPYCSNKKVLAGYNDLHTFCLNNHRLDIINEYDVEKNSCTIDEITPFSKKEIWWKCPKGHSYHASPERRIKRGSGCGICGHRILSENENDLLTTHPEIAKEWDYHKNIVTPNEVMAGSNQKKYWFICPKGHSYQTTLLNRKKGTNCPQCALERHTSFPEKAIFYYMELYFGEVEANYHNSALGAMEIDIYLAKYKTGIEYDGVAWHKHYRRDLDKDQRCQNNGIRLIRIRENGCYDYSSSSVKKYVEPYNMQELNKAILFIIEYLNTEYGLTIIASIDVDRDRIAILEKMNLSEKENSIAVYSPEIKQFWDYDKNGKITPEQIPHASNRKVFLKCVLGHEWEVAVNNFPSHPWCPYCSGRRVLSGFNDLFTTNPELKPLWSENNTIDPRKIKKGCNSKAIWLCLVCGSEYEMKISDKAKGYGCPYCSGHRVLKGFNDFATVFPELVKEWNYDKNYPLRPDDITSKSNKKMWWICDEGHEWQAKVYSRAKGSECPYCRGKNKLKNNVKG